MRYRVSKYRATGVDEFGLSNNLGTGGFIRDSDVYYYAGESDKPKNDI